MIAADIASALRAKPGISALRDLIREADTRTAEIRAQLQVMVPDDGPSNRRRLAVVGGPLALAAFEEEVEALQAEQRYLGLISSEIHSAIETAHQDEIRRSQGGNVKKLMSQVRQVRRDFGEFTKAIATLNELSAAVGEYANLPPGEQKCPLGDDELAELAQLRNDLWELPQVRILLVPPDDASRKQYPKAFPAIYEIRNEGSGVEVVRPRRQPGAVWLPDFASE